MKKILVVLLVLAVAGGVFAQQGEWSLSGKTVIGTFIDFNGQYTDRVTGATEKQPLSIGSGYNMPYDWWEGINGALNIKYNRGGFGGTITLDTFGDHFLGDFTYNGENFKYQVSANLGALIGSGLTTADEWAAGFNHAGRLWGSYNMLNKLLYLELAYNSRDTQFWTSDTTAGITDGGANRTAIGKYRFGNGDTFTKVDHHNYLLADIQLTGLSFGFMLPYLFATQVVGRDWQKPDYINENNGFTAALGGGHYQQKGFALIDDVVKGTIIGLKFAQSPFEFAAQFKVEDYGVYFGGKFFAGPVTAGLSFSGLFPDDGGLAQTIKVGANIDYNAGSFGANIKGYYGINGDDVTGATRIRIEPSFFYNAIPTHLQFKTAVRFDFNSVFAGGTETSNVVWRITPQLFWNFLGTGAGNWDTGIAARYVMERKVDNFNNGINELDITFKWSF